MEKIESNFNANLVEKANEKRRVTGSKVGSLKMPNPVRKIGPH